MFKLRHGAAFAAAFVIFLLLCSCGEIDSLFPVNRNYELSASTEKASASIDEFALIGENDAIQPFFVNSVIDNTDIHGIRILVKNAEGEQAGETIRYYIRTAEEPEQSSEISAESAQELAESSAEDSDDSSTSDSDQDTQNEKLIPVKQIYSELPAFTLSEDLEAGLYTIIFEVLDEKQKTISRTEKTFYYMAGKNYHITEIKASLPGLSSTPHLIQPGTTVLLEAQIESDERLNPYIIWYNGKTRIHSGKLSEGAGSILWTIPNPAMFLNLRVEVSPFPPRGAGVLDLSDGFKLRGKDKTISLAVSAKAQTPETLAPIIARQASNEAETEESGELRYYRFDGNLLDSLNPANEQALLPVDKQPRWVSSGYVYGLAAGPQDRYLIPAFPINSEKNIMRGFEIILNFKPLAPVTIFTVLFSEKHLALVYEEESVNLTLLTENQNAALLASIPHEKPDETGFITIPASFTLLEKELTIMFGDNKITLNHNPDDEGHIQIGGERARPEQDADSANGLKPNGLQPPELMILDELVLISYYGVLPAIDEALQSVENPETLLPQ